LKEKDPWKKKKFFRLPRNPIPSVSFLMRKKAIKTAINKAWHLKNRMPKNSTYEQRREWHIAHQNNCPCWPMPKKMAKEMKKAPTI